MAFGNVKQNFGVGQWVRIGQTTSPELDGMIARVAGKSSEHASCDFYIVLLTKKLSYTGAVAIQMVESCLEPVPELSSLTCMIPPC